jgi:hypothetical protein
MDPIDAPGHNNGKSKNSSMEKFRESWSEDQHGK